MFYSFLAKRTLITLSDGTTKAVDELVKDDKVLTYNYSAKNQISTRSFYVMPML